MTSRTKVRFLDREAGFPSWPHRQPQSSYPTSPQRNWTYMIGPFPDLAPQPTLKYTWLSRTASAYSPIRKTDAPVASWMASFPQ